MFQFLLCLNIVGALGFEPRMGPQQFLSEAMGSKAAILHQPKEVLPMILDEQLPHKSPPFQRNSNLKFQTLGFSKHELF